MIYHVALYIAAFLGIWIGAGLAIKSVEKISHKLRLSSFSVSFLVLGFFTSLSEFSVGVNSIIADDPEIFVGNLIGASIVLLLMVVPLLAIAGHKINISKSFRGFHLALSLVVIAAPVVLSLDGIVNRLDSAIALLLYIFLVIVIQGRSGLANNVKGLAHMGAFNIAGQLLYILVGVVLIFGSSSIIVNQTMYFSQALGMSPFLISLLFIAIGTNIPEISFGFRSLFMKSNQVAFGDYVGSASFNSCLFGILTLWYGKPILLTNSYLVSLVFFIVGLIAFYYFARTKNSITRTEGIWLLLLYLLFLFVEFKIH